MNRVPTHRSPVETLSRPPLAAARRPGDPAGAAAAPAPAGSPAAQLGTEPPRKPQLLLIHGGSFLFEDPIFEPLTGGARRSPPASSRTTSTYPLGNLPAAVLAARAEARRLRREVRRRPRLRLRRPRPAARWRRCSPATAWSPPRSPRRRSPTSSTWEWPLDASTAPTTTNRSALDRSGPRPALADAPPGQEPAADRSRAAATRSCRRR